ncbi:uncharacterized protein LOC118738642 [Rhagoletis pomonella]|uniref:uncharacterized protein LOC118738642 n=1 Tax=Rhagoletis pomonella TaxID=28610 RepID=UPI0017837F26|nr:uncharacterized protein LOC118738642 [Rhagoletis pomonella]
MSVEEAQKNINALSEFFSLLKGLSANIIVDSNKKLNNSNSLTNVIRTRSKAKADDRNNLHLQTVSNKTLASTTPGERCRINNSNTECSALGVQPKKVVESLILPSSDAAGDGPAISGGGEADDVEMLSSTSAQSLMFSSGSHALPNTADQSATTPGGVATFMTPTLISNTPNASNANTENSDSQPFGIASEWKIVTNRKTKTTFSY